jgi:NADH-quinone oxidoreductase subunit E
MGSDDVVDHISNKLGIKEGETTPDGMFTLKTVECLGSCGTAPMMMIGAQFHENLTFDKVDNILDKLTDEGKRKTYLDEVLIDKY